MNAYIDVDLELLESTVNHSLDLMKELAVSHQIGSLCSFIPLLLAVLVVDYQRIAFYRTWSSKSLHSLSFSASTSAGRTGVLQV